MSFRSLSHPLAREWHVQTGMLPHCVGRRRQTDVPQAQIQRRFVGASTEEGTKLQLGTNKPTSVWFWAVRPKHIRPHPHPQDSVAALDDADLLELFQRREGQHTPGDTPLHHKMGPSDHQREQDESIQVRCPSG